MSPKILIVDDSRTVRLQIATALSHAKYQVVEAEDGAAGLAAIESHPDIALVICDVTMPIMDGIEMLRRVKADARSAALPVLMLTAEGKADLIQEVKRLGAKGWIVKPFKPDQLVASVRKLVGQ